MASDSIKHHQATTAVVAALSTLALVWYGTFLFDPAHIGHPVAYALLVIAEVIGMINSLGIWLSLLASPGIPPLPYVDDVFDDLVENRIHPSVAVFITCCRESVDTIRATAIAAKDMHVKHRTVLLDDGDDDAVRALAKELNIDYLRRDHKTGAKAGNINNALKHIPCDYFAILDCDHVPKPDFLLQLMPFLLKDEMIAFVQTPQCFDNVHMFVSGGSAETQETFYRHIQPRKNLFNAAFCVGTNVIFRREAIEEIGGMYEGSKSEDIWTSLLLHERGWKSLFVPAVLAVGQTPETVDAVLRQQTRWARGGFEILLSHPTLGNEKLSWGQRLQYWHTCLYYLSGFSTLIFYVMPLLYVYFEWKPVNAPNEPFAWIIRFLPYYIFTFTSNMYLLGRSPLWRTFVITLTTFPAHISAFLSVLTGTSLQWSVTGTIKRQRDYITSVLPHILILLLTAGALPILLLKPEEQPLSLVFAFWMCWNIAALFSICKRAIPRYAHGMEPVKAAYAFTA